MENGAAHRKGQCPPKLQTIKKKKKLTLLQRDPGRLDQSSLSLFLVKRAGPMAAKNAPRMPVRSCWAYAPTRLAWGVRNVFSFFRPRGRSKRAAVWRGRGTGSTATVYNEKLILGQTKLTTVLAVISNDFKRLVSVVPAVVLGVAPTEPRVPRRL